jgi:hypothetical protein
MCEYLLILQLLAMNQQLPVAKAVLLFDVHGKEYTGYESCTSLLHLLRENVTEACAERHGCLYTSFSDRPNVIRLHIW